MRSFWQGIILVCLAVSVFSQDSSQGPTDSKAQKNYQEGLKAMQQREWGVALSYFRQADKQDGGRCIVCQEQMIQLGLQNDNWKAVEDGAGRHGSGVRHHDRQRSTH